MLRRRWLVAMCCALGLHALVGLFPRSEVRRAPVIGNSVSVTAIELELKTTSAAPAAPAARPDVPARHLARPLAVPRVAGASDAPSVAGDSDVPRVAVPSGAPPAEESAAALVDDAPTRSFAPRRIPESVAGVPAAEDDTESRIRGFVARSQADAGVPDFYALTPGDAGSLVYESKELKGVIAVDGSIAFQEKPPFEAFTGKLLEFDLNGPLQRLAGNDPTALQKSCVMDATRELRVARREEADRKRQSAALSDLSATLDRIWRDKNKSNHAKRRAIFELWDECRDDAVGAQARDVIVAFIRREMPKGTHLAYTSGELAHYNKVRTAKEEFAPYS